MCLAFPWHSYHGCCGHFTQSVSRSEVLVFFLGLLPCMHRHDRGWTLPPTIARRACWPWLYLPGVRHSCWPHVLWLDPACAGCMFVESLRMRAALDVSCHCGKPYYITTDKGFIFYKITDSFLMSLRNSFCLCIHQHQPLFPSFILSLIFISENELYVNPVLCLRPRVKRRHWVLTCLVIGKIKLLRLEL